MSLATRCTACGTVFRVVQDQLKVSEGWVRCGQCSAVFNALEGLFDLAREAPIDAVGTAGEMPPGEQARDLRSPALVAPPDADGTRGPDERAVVSDEPIGAPSIASEVTVSAESAASPLEEQAPGFVTEARRRARWHSPGWRAALSVSAALLLALLGLQGAHHFRDSVAARWPAMQPALTAWCTAAGCTVRPPRRIEDIAVESTALARSPGLPQAFELAVVLRNRGALPTALPSVDLSLTDSAGRVVSRRMLSATDFGASPSALRPGAETTWQMLMSTDNEPVSGYTVELFYP